MIMRKVYLIIAASLVLAAGLNACSGRRNEPLRGPLVLTDEETIKGQKLFMQYCQKCHPMGEAGLGPSLNASPAPKFAERFQMRHGLGVMPAFKKDELNDEQLKQIAKYLKALKHHKGEG